MEVAVKKSFNLQEMDEKAELLKTLAHPIRLCIIKGLIESGECNVQKMQFCLNIPQSTVSQHLAKLRVAGIVKPHRIGTEVFYEVEHELVRNLIKVLFKES